MVEWTAILEAVGRSQTDDRASGRDGLDGCWQRTGPDDHAYRCVLAHYLADLQDCLDAEVSWDETALEEYAHLRGPDLAAIDIPDAAGLAPSLHLNLGDGYLRQGRVDEAAEQLRRGRAAIGTLGEDGYGRMIRAGLAGLESRISAMPRRADEFRGASGSVVIDGERTSSAERP
ncbi:MAG: hypothetical protein ABJA74_04035 [Lapillicoccus sp.]